MFRVTATVAAPEAPDPTSPSTNASAPDHNNPTAAEAAAAEAAVSVVSAAAPEAAAMQLDSVKLLFDGVPPVMHVGRDYALHPQMTGGDTSGAVVQYSISPALPAGLTLDSTTGIITGRPTQAGERRSYTVRASFDGTDTFKEASVKLQVRPIDTLLILEAQRCGLPDWWAQDETGIAASPLPVALAQLLHGLCFVEYGVVLDAQQSQWKLKPGCDRVYRINRPLRSWQQSFTSHAAGAAAEGASGSAFDAQQTAQQMCNMLLQHEGVEACIIQGPECFLELTVSEVVLGHELRRKCGRVELTTDHVELSNAERMMRMLQQAVDDELRPALVDRVCEVMQRFQAEVLDVEIPAEQQVPDNELYCALIQQHFRGSKGAQLHIYNDKAVQLTQLVQHMFGGS